MSGSGGSNGSSGNGTPIARTATGQFQKGFSGNPKGRPRAIDFKTLIRARMEADGKTPEDAMYAVFASVLRAALAGDMTAAKLLIDRMCEAEATEHRITLEEIITQSRRIEDRLGIEGD